jgi:hypothetical protein
MSHLSSVERVALPRNLAVGTQAHLRRMGTQGSEGMALWAGVFVDDSGFKVTNLIVPHQQGIRTPDGICVTVPSEELHRLNVALYKNKLTLLAQVHSHPGRAYHSEMDDRYAIATQVGSLSLVVPDFAVRPFSLSDCAIYRLRERSGWFDRGGWRQLSMGAVSKLISIED